MAIVIEELTADNLNSLGKCDSEFVIDSKIIPHYENGKLTYTLETTTLKIFPLELGVRYLFPLSETCKVKLFPYLGAGAGYYMIKEDNPIGNLDEKRTGFFMEGGLRFYLVKSFFIDAKLKDVLVKSKAGIKVGGFAYMAGLGISF